MTLAAFILTFGVGFVLGVYGISQIEKHIDENIKNKK